MGMLCFEVEFLTGVSVAATPNTRGEPEWPPHPDRLFQALVAAWGRNAEPDEAERRALEWLECLDKDSHLVKAPAAYPREVATVYVPPNDARTTGKVGAKPPSKLAPALRPIPAFRKNRQPRAFPAMLPKAALPMVRYCWQRVPDLDVHKDVLARLARQVTYLGHSHTLVRVSLVEDGACKSDGEEETWVPENGAALRMPYKGRLADLTEWYRQSQNGRIARPAPSLVTRKFEQKRAKIPPSTLFDSSNVTVFADNGGFVPSLEAFPLVAKRLRDALIEIAGKEGLPIPTLISGHDEDGKPTVKPHIAMVPLADAGWTHSQGRLMGLALVWPNRIEQEEHRTALKVVAGFADKGSEIGLLHFGRDGSWRVELEPESDRASLRFERYLRASRRWATVLPAVLDRYPKNKPGEELTDIVMSACLNIGLSHEAVDGLDIAFHKYSVIKGAPSVHEVRKALSHDSRYRDRLLAHLVLTFAKPVRGPLILGAGRFRGLGLCQPLMK